MPQALNNASSFLAADHTSGSGTLVVRTGEGTRFGTPTVDSPVLVTVTSRSTLVAGQIAPTSLSTIFNVTSRSGDTLTYSAAVEGTTDRNYRINDPAAALITAGMLAPISAAAVDSAVVHKTGTETISGVKTHSAKVVHDLVANTTGLVRQAIPSVTSATDAVVWSEGAYSFSNGDVGPTYNHVFSQGWNVDANGAALDPTRISVRAVASEYRFKNSSIYQSEQHWLCLTYPGDANEYRTITASAYHATKTCGVTINTSGFTIVDETRPVGNLLYSLTWDHAGSLQATYTVSGVTAGGFNFAPAGDSFSCGRATSPTTAIQYRGAALQWDFINNTTTWSYRLNTGASDLELLKGGTQVAVFGGATGTLGQLSLVAPAAQAGGSGVLLFSGSGKQGALRQDVNGNLILAPDPAATLYFSVAGGFTNSLSPAGVLTVASTFVCGGGILSGGALFLGAAGAITLRGDSTTTANRNQAVITPSWSDNTDASRKGRVTFAASDATTNREGLRIESDGTQALVSLGGGTLFKKLLSATATLDFPSVAAAGQQELTVSVTGAATDDPVFISRPSGLTAGLVVTARVSAADTVTVRASNITASPIDPASASYRAVVLKF